MGREIIVDLAKPNSKTDNNNARFTISTTKNHDGLDLDNKTDLLINTIEQVANEVFEIRDKPEPPKISKSIRKL